MLYTIIKKNAYQDSVNLMLLTNKLSTLEGIQKVSIMMGTEANKDIFKNSGLFTEELANASANDMCIVVNTEDESKVQEILNEIDSFLKNQSISNNDKGYETVRTWDKAMKAAPDANIALISVPGKYAASEADQALDQGLHAFIFSDNVPLEEELRLKEKAHNKGLLVMGPDCGTGILSGIPMAFANVVNTGNIGIVGASGTGIQEVSTIIDRLGGGVSHAIGTGGRDLSEKIGAITMMDGILGLEHHPQTEVIAIISKPPAKEVRNQVVELLQQVSKPVVAIFLGEKPEKHEGNVYHAYTLEETARIAVDLANEKEVMADYNALQTEIPQVDLKDSQTSIKGLYSGGSLASEAAMLISDALQLKDGLIKEEGYMLKADGHEVVDLGDDMYTQGKPHPMIDPDTRIQFIHHAVQDPTTAIVLFDVVLGYGSHEDMANQLVPAIVKAREAAEKEGRHVYFVATVCGTDQDPQNYREQKQILENAGIIVRDSNNQAVRTAIKMTGLNIEDVQKQHHQVDVSSKEDDASHVSSEAVQRLLREKPIVINVGLKKFSDTFMAFGTRVVQFDWRPVAGGNERMQKILKLLNSYEAK